MPKFKTERIIIKDEERNTLFDFKLDINIDADGHFTCNMPEDVAKRLEEVGVPLLFNSRTKRRGYFCSPTYDGLVNEVRKAFTIFSTKEVVSQELVIRYELQTTCSYMMHDGKYIPNGSFAYEEFGKSCDQLGLRWRGGTKDTHAQKPEPFGFLLYTEVCRKVEYKFVGRENKVEHEHIWCGRDLEREDGPELWWLSGIVSNCAPSGKYKLQEIPGTEENAAFFNALYKYIFGINEKIAFLAKKENLIDFISNNKQLLLK